MKPAFRSFSGRLIVEQKESLSLLDARDEKQFLSAGEALIEIHSQTIVLKKDSKEYVFHSPVQTDLMNDQLLLPAGLNDQPLSLSGSLQNENLSLVFEREGPSGSRAIASFKTLRLL
ncbi:MAG: hypothetical protein AB1540_11935 [Bdellovibrionota bacterium]